MGAAVSGWEITEWTIAIGATLTALGIIHHKIMRPVIGFVRRFKAWMDRIEHAVMWVDEQMRPNGGSTLVDKVNMLLEHDATRDIEGKRYGATAEEDDT
jgi:hypothetical protein